MFPLEKDCLRACCCVRRRPWAAKGASSPLGSLWGRMRVTYCLSVRGREERWAWSGAGPAAVGSAPAGLSLCGDAESGMGRDITRPLFQGEATRSLAQTRRKHWERLSLLQPAPGNSITFFVSQFPATWTLCARCRGHSWLRFSSPSNVFCMASGPRLPSCSHPAPCPLYGRGN